MPRCCPYLKNGHCLVAVRLRICRGGGGGCVVVHDRCCGVLRTVDGREVGEWETCRLYRLASSGRVRV